MANHKAEISQRHTAIIAGCGLLIMTLFYIYADFFIFKKLIVAGDASATANNIMVSAVLFRNGIGCILIVLLSDVIVAWALYVFLLFTVRYKFATSILASFQSAKSVW